MVDEASEAAGPTGGNGHSGPGDPASLPDLVPQLLAAAFGALSIACFVLNLFGAVVAASPAAEQLLQRGNIIRLTRGRLAAANRDDQAAFERLLTGIASGGPGSGESMRLRQQGGETPARVRIVPMPRDIIRHGAALLLIVDIPPGLTAGHCARQWGLTPAESDVALELLSGVRPKQISMKRGVSHETVRAQIRNIYAKLGTRSRFEFLALANGLNDRVAGGGAPDRRAS